MTPHVVMVPGLRGDTPTHWQQVLTPALGATHLPTHRAPDDLAGRTADITASIESREGPVLLVGHSAGVLTILHWAQAAGAGLTGRVHAALLVTPPTLERELPEAYPRLEELRRTGWLPLPAGPLPFDSTVLVSDDDPLGPPEEVEALAGQWGSSVLGAGPVGHANPAAGFGDWPFVAECIRAVGAGVQVH
ncbi:hypothetical protein ASG73_13485 [Janibacter sp. Soil728]|uniref:RBBP9/YdeN family alpha/beta hydrolase n=1 Tax=Janibacter sp. Soil728 TaxID=1736393 RepID=UPI0006F3A481|nr:alpha/beta hydrolase [Janibacter sp. Soil728]KRE35720.1 hypothetical protein ASG73_13485 [Janibacter sp. Soil728]